VLGVADGKWGDFANELIAVSGAGCQTRLRRPVPQHGHDRLFPKRLNRPALKMLQEGRGSVSLAKRTPVSNVYYRAVR